MAGPTCKFGNCNNAVWYDPNGSPSKYCSISHKRFAELSCLVCHANAKSDDNAFCSKQCEDIAYSRAPGLLKVPHEHIIFQSVAKQFQDTWKHKSKVPVIKRIYKTLPSKTSIERYEKYRNSVEARGQFLHTTSNKPRLFTKGNQQRRWHGTNRECLLGSKKHIHLCHSAHCSLCRIIQVSFDLKFSGAKNFFGRFGHGIYTSATSSKANDYSRNVGRHCDEKTMLLNKVVVGKGYKLRVSAPFLTGPPHGFDSVLGEVGDHLNYDEVVVYSADAIRPAYLVIYE